jgi:hypothetical protein
MKTPNLPAWLLVLGVGIVLFIGAFARFDPAGSAHPTAPSPPVPPPLTEANAPAEAAGEPAWPANLSPGLAEIIKLAQAHVDEGVILSYIKNSGQLYSPSADEILYLADLGLSQNVIAALFKQAPPATPQASQETAASFAPVPPPAAPPALAFAPLPVPSPALQPASAPPADLFHDDLAPYGAWTQEADYGFCWQPTVETVNPGWRPYFDAGQWLYSDSGWYWQSDYSWGWAVFHYGRWVNLPRRGWVWVPDNLWAPAWVAWRATPSYIGWAPLPPGVGLNVLAQLTYGSRPAGRSPDLGLTASSYSFVSTGNFIGRNLPRHAAPSPRVADLVKMTSVIDGYAIVNNRIFNGGISRDAVAVAARRPVPEVALRAVCSPESAGFSQDGKTLAVLLPGRSGASTAVSALSGPLAAKPSAALAENNGARPFAAPPASDDAEPAVELPPLRYPASSSPALARSRLQSGSLSAAPDSQVARRGWPRDFGAPAAERPAAPAPRLESPAWGQRQAAPRAAAESRPAPVEPVRPAAPAPVPQSPSASTSKSGK